MKRASVPPQIASIHGANRPFLHTPILRVLSFAAAAAVAVFAAFEIGAIATRFREAWKHLNAASIAFKNDTLDIDGLLNAYREGEVLIGQMKANTFQKSEPDG